MAIVTSPDRTDTPASLSGAPSRSAALADRLERGAQALAALAATLTDAEWRLPLPGDGRPVGVVVHHVANMYPIEIKVALTVAAGEPITGLTMADVHAINAAHAKEFAGVARGEALALLDVNSRAAASAIRSLTDADLDRATTASLYADAPVTCQFVLEDHAVRHSYHHVSGIRRALGRRS